MRDEVSWEDIAAAAADIFNIWASKGDLAWAQEAWKHLAAAGFTEATTPIERTRTLLRLVLLGKIYEDFSAAKWGENPERSLYELCYEVEIDKLALGLLAAEARPAVEWSEPEGDKLYEEALTVAAEPLRVEIWRCLTTAYGGVDALYVRLSQTAQGNLEKDAGVVTNDRESAQDSGFADCYDVTGCNVEAYAYVENGFHR